ncbi:MAG: CAP domain-containing protein [Anaerolineales bacterium]
MIKKLFIVTTLITLALSSCNGQGSAELTATPATTDTQAPTAIPATTQAPAVTETASPSPDGTAATSSDVSPTAGAVYPTNDPNCINSATFVADVSIPDNTNITAGTTFTKTWRIGNTGSCIWTPEYVLTYYSEERMGAVDVPLSITYPGYTVDISVNLTAPTTPGTYQANFIIQNSADQIVKVGDDSRLWVVINVPAGGAAASTATATATTGAVTAVSTIPASTASGAGTSSCLFTIDRLKLMEVIRAVNAYRQEKGLPALTVNPQLAQAAQKHANDMACSRFSDHTGSDDSTPQSRVAAAGYTASSVAENIYSSSPPFTGEGVVNFWITDTADANNNRNLLSTTFTEIGVGYSSFNGSGYYVIVFAKR